MTPPGAEVLPNDPGAVGQRPKRGSRQRNSQSGDFGDQDRRAPREHNLGYSRFVSLMKVLLPFIALSLILLVIAWPNLKLQDTKFGLGFSALKMGDNADPAMINPRFFGTDDRRQTFSITADLAKNLLSDERHVELEKPKADISLEDGSWLVVTASLGYFARQEEKLMLQGGVNMFHDSGYEFRTDKVDVDLATGTASSDVPVEGQGPFGHVAAEGFRLLDKGKTVVFSGKSRLIIYPGASTAGNSGSDQ